MTRQQQFYEWGLNCQVLKFTQEQAQKAKDAYSTSFKSHENDSFWNGYYNGSRPEGAELVSITIK